MDKLDELKKENTRLTNLISNEVGSSTMDLINELIENELQQEELCGE